MGVKEEFGCLTSSGLGSQLLTYKGLCRVAGLGGQADYYAAVITQSRSTCDTTHGFFTEAGLEATIVQDSPDHRPFYGQVLEELRYATKTGMDLGPAYMSVDQALQGGLKRPVMPGAATSPARDTPAPGGQG